MHWHHKDRHRYKPLVIGFFACLIFSVAGVLFSPLFSGKAYAASTSLNLVRYPQQGGEPDIATCEPYFADKQEQKTINLLENSFYGQAGDLSSQDLERGNYQTLLGYKPNTVTGAEIEQLFQRQPYTNMSLISPNQMRFVLNGMNSSTVPVLRFRATGNPPANGGTVNPIDEVCRTLVMLPVSANEWRGAEGDNPTLSGGPFSALTNYMRFVRTDTNNTDGVTNGTFYYYNPDYFASPPAPTTPDQFYKTFSNFTIENNVPGSTTAPGGGTINVTSANWVDASTIKLVGSDGGTFTKTSWSADAGRSIYFMSAADPAKPERAGLVSAWRCRDPLDGAGKPLRTCPDPSGVYQPNCVPFVVLNHAFNFSRTAPFSQLVGAVNGLGGATGKYYNYTKSDTGCSLVNSDGINVDPSPDANAQIWLTYSSANKQFQTLFLDGDGNEKIYLGIYQQSAASGLAFAGGLDGCKGIILANSASDLARPDFPVKWQLGRENKACADADRFYGTLDVKSFGGPIGEARFEEIQGVITGDASDETRSAVPVTCDSTSKLAWVGCAIIEGLERGIKELDKLLYAMMVIDPDKYFDETCKKSPLIQGLGPNKCSGSQLYAIWGGMRIIAIGIIVIVALFIAISQTLGLAIVKKLLLSTLIATIVIPFTWDLVKGAAVVSGILSTGIQELIFSPFLTDPSNPSQIYINQVLGAGLTAAAGGALIALGVMGMLTLVITAFLGISVAFIVLAIVLFGIVLGAPLTPVLVAFLSNPLTARIGKAGLGGLGLLFLIPTVLMAIFAGGRAAGTIFASVGGLVFLIMAILATYGPLFFFPRIITSLPGAMGGIGKVAAGLTDGLSKGVSKYRSNIFKDRMERLGQGSLYNTQFTDRFGPLRWLNPLRAVNRIGAHAGAMRGRGGWRMGFGGAGRSKMWMNNFATMESYRQNHADFNAYADDEETMAAHALSEDRQAMGRLRAFQREVAPGVWVADDASIDRAINASSGIRASAQSRFAAAHALAASGRIFQPGTAGRQELRSVVRHVTSRVSTDRPELSQGLMAYMNWAERGAGRTDIGWTRLDSTAAPLDDVRDAFTSLSVLTAQNATQLNEQGAIGAAQSARDILRAYTATGGTLTITDKLTGQPRQITRQEAQHFADVLYTITSNTSLPGHAQLAAREAWDQVGNLGQGFQGQAVANAAKLIGGGIPDLESGPGGTRVGTR